MRRITGLMVAAALVLACGVVSAQEKKDKGGKRGNSVMGQIVKVDGKSVTVKITPRGGKDGGEAPAATERVLTLDDSTTILKQTGEMEPPAADGKKGRPKTAPATLADLQEGQRISAALGDGDKVTSVTIQAPRGGGKSGGKGKGKAKNGGDAN